MMGIEVGLRQFLHRKALPFRSSSSVSQCLPPAERQDENNHSQAEGIGKLVGMSMVPAAHSLHMEEAT